MRSNDRNAVRVVCQSGIAAAKLPPSAMKTFDFAALHRLQRGHDVMAMGGGWLETEAVFEPIEEVLFRDLGDADGSVALYVGMAADRAQSGAWTTDIAA